MNTAVELLPRHHDEEWWRLARARNSGRDRGYMKIWRNFGARTPPCARPRAPRFVREDDPCTTRLGARARVVTSPDDEYALSSVIATREGCFCKFYLIQTGVRNTLYSPYRGAVSKSDIETSKIIDHIIECLFRNLQAI